MAERPAPDDDNDAMLLSILPVFRELAKNDSLGPISDAPTASEMRLDATVLLAQAALDRRGPASL